MVDYNRSLYSKTIDLASAEYAKARSEVCKFSYSVCTQKFILMNTTGIFLQEIYVGIFYTLPSGSFKISTVFA